ncbi:protein of unknown function DUF433 [Geminocystis sp. NIES-3708]|uniref:DUF433 domain-containing protein n=1 Tax=Geminocystis sp. NIES-3708 TaxID=1615909 RepID=UPI0005FCA148|nr:DUF433 domain-containing protein [Geminocystis sp. NIES-3708]BAQ61157.1 protein of unknown function DUF433 [Geminocystis sp. NIES-3708]
MENTKVILGRITFNSEIMGGRACIRGMRITVALVLKLLASDMSIEEILREYPDLELGDIQASLNYASLLADEKVYSFEQKVA